MTEEGSPPTSAHEFDPDLCGSCTGIGLKYPQLWETAERYVRRGDGFHQQAGMKLVADFAPEMPLDDAASLIEWHFARHNFLPMTPARGNLDGNALTAAVAVGLAIDSFSLQESPSRRLRMAAVVVQCLLACADSDEAEDRERVERALRALELNDRHWCNGGRTLETELMQSGRLDHELVERCSAALQERRLDEAIRAAMIVLENRLRASTGATLDTVGVDLAVKAFKLDSELNFGETPAEREGLLNLFRSTILMFRNPVAHRFAEHEVDRTLHVLILVNLLLDLISEANTRLYRPGDYLAPDETPERLRVERVLHVDLDGDSNNERVLVYSGRGTLGYLFLKQVGGEWRRRDVEDRSDSAQRGMRLDSLAEIALTGASTRRVLVRATTGGGDRIIQILQWDGSSVHFVRFNGEGNVSEDNVFSSCEDGVPQFRDTDGDGQLELYVPRSRKFPPTGRGDVVRYTEVYKFDDSRRCYRFVKKKPAGGQHVKSDDARRFLTSLDSSLYPDWSTRIQIIPKEPT